MRKGRDGKRKEKKEKRMAFLVATTSLPAVYRPNGYARTTTAGTPHARANLISYHTTYSANITLTRQKLTKMLTLDMKRFPPPCDEWLF